MATTVEEIADRTAIDEQLACYCRAIDTGEWDLLDGIFTRDAVLDYTSSGGIRGGGRPAAQDQHPGQT